MPDSSARWLGYAGLLPFLGCALAAHGASSVADLALQALVAYAALIATFLGGIHWGFGFASGRSGWALFGWGVTPSLLAWVALLLPVQPGLLLLSATLVVAFAVDRRVYPRFGAEAWLGLRLQLSAVAVLCCLVGAWAA
ncbi:MAG: DUF3429 domain-containing protein [Rubrivivax sp.]